MLVWKIPLALSVPRIAAVRYARRRGAPAACCAHLCCIPAFFGSSNKATSLSPEECLPSCELLRRQPLISVDGGFFQLECFRQTPLPPSGAHTPPGQYPPTLHRRLKPSAPLSEAGVIFFMKTKVIQKYKRNGNRYKYANPSIFGFILHLSPTPSLNSWF